MSCSLLPPKMDENQPLFCLAIFGADGCSVGVVEARETAAGATGAVVVAGVGVS
jgi:hypothetical protein